MTDRAREQAERIMRAVTSLECCPQCYEPKFPQGQEAGGEKALGWPGCVNSQCVACGEQQCSVAFRDPSETALLLQKRLNDLRQWVTDHGGEFVFEESK